MPHQQLSSMSPEYVRLPLTNAPACDNGPGCYIASVYYAAGAVERADFALGTVPPDQGDEPLLAEVNERLANHNAYLGRHSAAAVQIVRFCLNEHGYDAPSVRGPRMEIGDTLVVAAPDSPRLQIEPIAGRRFFGNVATRGGDNDKVRNPLIIPAAKDAPAPRELVCVRQENSYLYVALRGTERLVRPSFPVQ